MIHLFIRAQMSLHFIAFAICFSAVGCGGQSAANTPYSVDCTAVPGASIKVITIELGEHKLTFQNIAGGRLVGEGMFRGPLPPKCRVSWITDSNESHSTELPVSSQAYIHRKSLVLQFRFISNSKIKLVYYRGEITEPESFFDPLESAAEKTQRLAAKKLCDAAKQGDLETVKHLVEQGADIDSRLEGVGDSALEIAASSANLEMTRYLLDKGANVGKSLTHSSFWADKKILELLVNHGADVNGKTAFSEFPIVNAIRGKKVENAEWLIDHGADFWSDHGTPSYCPLTLAVISGSPEILRLMISKSNAMKTFSAESIREARRISAERVIRPQSAELEKNDQEVANLLKSLK